MSDSFNREKLHINLARIKREGSVFEISIDPDKAVMYSKGENVDIRDVLQSEQIFDDVKKGLRASTERMEAIFGTSDALEVAAIILKEGDIQVSAMHRASERDEKRQRIVGMIHANAIDPRTKAPHPPQRIQAAMEQAKIRIDEYKSAEEQIEDIVQKLRPQLPIVFEVKELEIHLLSEHAHKGYGSIKKQSKILRENWNNDGSWTGIVEIPGGLYDEFVDMINAMTHGRGDVKVSKTR